MLRVTKILFFPHSYAHFELQQKSMKGELLYNVIVVHQ